jgi:glycosyltransferase involved in cell wall biosynthesis
VRHAFNQQHQIVNQLVSVIIPTYNRGDLIGRAIASVIAQTYQNLEIIVVDDASTEDIAQAIAHIDDPRLRSIRHETNLGGSAARNTGIKAAQGEFVAFLDSDDTWLPHKLQRQLEAISLVSRSDNLVCYSQFKSSPKVFYAPSVFPSRGKQPQETVADYLWAAQGEMLTSSLLMHRSLAQRTLFQPGLIKHQDLDFVIRLEQQGAVFVFVPQVLTIWHNEVRGDRISRNRDYQLSLNWINIYRDQISERALQGFMLKEIVPKMLLNPENKSQAVKMLIKGRQAKLIPLNRFLFLIIQQAIPRQYQQSLKALLQKAKLIKKP